MARWGWGRGCKDCGPVDHEDVWLVKVFDGSQEIREYVDFVDEEKGAYRVLVTDPPGQTVPPPGTTIRPPFLYDHVKGEAVREMRRAKAGLKVFRERAP